MTTYFTSSGIKVSQKTIDRYRALAYKQVYEFNPIPVCKGCEEERATESSHIIPQYRCKHLRKTELIWDVDNFFPACRSCHEKWESNKKDLKNYQDCMNFLEKHDIETYNKRTL